MRGVSCTPGEVRADSTNGGLRGETVAWVLRPVRDGGLRVCGIRLPDGGLVGVVGLILEFVAVCARGGGGAAAERRVQRRVVRGVLSVRVHAVRGISSRLGSLVVAEVVVVLVVRLYERRRRRLIKVETRVRALIISRHLYNLRSRSGFTARRLC